MRFIILCLFLISSSAFAKKTTCKQLDAALEMMDYKKVKNIGEKPVTFGDINQARKYAYDTPLFKDLGFGDISASSGWKKYKGTMNRSKLKDKFIGWEKKVDGLGHARVRIDEPIPGAKKAHFNIEIDVRHGANKGSYKVAVEFDCGGPCSVDQIVKYVEKYQ